ncbi:acyl-CoA carboxylase epsilon subunit [Actinosynnema sp. NPDC053489]|uniref:acyl-CoA carboxylase epsilon subunit n=1 Tax=Actinosynnema sp. NPDC053489 TaxID=3363916 RepID=UPI0037CA7EA4
MTALEPARPLVEPRADDHRTTAVTAWRPAPATVPGSPRTATPVTDPEPARVPTGQDGDDHRPGAVGGPAHPGPGWPGLADLRLAGAVPRSAGHVGGLGDPEPGVAAGSAGRAVAVGEPGRRSAGDAAAAEPALLLRVVKGDPDPVELAALAAVLRLRAAAAVAVADEAVPRRAARWRRPERVAGFAGARTWRN